MILQSAKTLEDHQNTFEITAPSLLPQHTYKSSRFASLASQPLSDMDTLNMLKLLYIENALAGNKISWRPHERNSAQLGQRRQSSERVVGEHEHGAIVPEHGSL